jgi:hypothetical protein
MSVTPLHPAEPPATESVLGLTATQIARRTHRKVGAVRTGLAVAGSELAAAASGRYDLTLEQAGVLAEFDGDVEAVKALTVTAVKEPGQCEHLAQRLRDKRAAAAREAVAAELAASCRSRPTGNGRWRSWSTCRPTATSPVRR